MCTRGLAGAMSRVRRQKPRRMTSGGHAVTAALVASGVAGRRHHEAFHRFFSRGTWSPDVVGKLLLAGILRRAAVIELVVDGPTSSPAGTLTNTKLQPPVGLQQNLTFTPLPGSPTTSSSPLR